MKRLIYVAALVCSASTACVDREDPVAGQKWRHDGGNLSALHAEQAETTKNPVFYLRALDAALKSDSAASRYNRALLQQELFLTSDAEASWAEVLRRDPSEEWKAEARKHLARLNTKMPRWDAEALKGALQRRDAGKVREIAREFPKDAIAYAVSSGLSDLQGLQILGEALTATGDMYVRDIAQSTISPDGQKALQDGMQALGERKYEQAASTFERAGNPLYLSARFSLSILPGREDAQEILDKIIAVTEERHYRDLELRARIYRANKLEGRDQYFQARAAYAEILSSNVSPTRRADALVRRSSNSLAIGKPLDALRDSLEALKLLPYVANLNARHQAYGTTARAARTFGYPAVALQFANTTIGELLKTVADGREIREAKGLLAVAFRERADIRIQLGQNDSAETDLAKASAFAEAAESDVRLLLRMRLAEVKGEQALRRRQPAVAVDRFTEAIQLAENEHSTYRAALYSSRAIARGSGPAADQDLATALEIVRTEGKTLRAGAKVGEYENLWKPYFARFEAIHHRLIESLLTANGIEGAFVQTERARAFEPMQLVQQAGPLPQGFRRIETARDLERALAEIPEDTLILQYLVLGDRTHSWVLSRNQIRHLPHRAGRTQIQRWVDTVHSTVKAGQDGSIRTAMRSAYVELFAVPLAGSRHKRIVIIPDGPMHGLPFAALESQEGNYLIERSSIAVAGSTSLYLYALHRDQEFRPTSRPSVLIVGEPKLHPQFAAWGNLPNALKEAEELHRDYADSDFLEGDEATSERFLAAAKDATIIHFAGHAVANSIDTWRSMLLLTPQGKDYGDLTAEKLLTRVQNLAQTRLIVLAACSTASGESVGAEGLAPLVRPLVAARVPAVVGTLWDVKDTATIKDLLVSFHRHYQTGDDVAVALQKAQLTMLRDNKPAREWAALQAVGYAESPFAIHSALEERHNGRFRIANSLHRPDGLRSQ